MNAHSGSRRCLVAISSHGFGHFAQVAPLINETTRQITDLQLEPVHWILRTTLAPQMLRHRLLPHVEIDPAADDFGMVMHDAIHTDLVASLRQYAQAHDQWAQRVETLAEHLRSLNVQLLLADVPYLTLAAAAQAGIPSLAICSLNWADILWQCVQEHPTALHEAGLSRTQFESILQQMRDAYHQATYFFRPEPSMNMPLLQKSTAVGPVFELPTQPDRSKLLAWAQQHGCSLPGWFVLVSMGGIPTPLNISGWPRHCLNQPIYYIVAGAQANTTPDSLSAHACPLDYATLLASCDLIISKPGYGTFVEVASLSKPLIYLERPGWPESSSLTHWIQKRGYARAISAEQLNTPALSAAMVDLLTQQAPPPLYPHGNRVVATKILQLLDARRSP